MSKPPGADKVASGMARRRGEDESSRESEERYRRLLDVSPDAVFLRDENGLVSYINPAGLRILGATDDAQIVGRSNLLFVHPRCHRAVEERVRQVHDGEIVPPLEEQFVRTDGSVVDVEVIAAPFFHAGKPWAQVLFRDITRRKQTEEALEYRRKFEHLITSISSHFINLSPAETDDAINAALRLIGEFTGADRSYLFFLKEDRITAAVTHEWCAEGIRSEMQAFQNTVTEGDALFAEPLLRSEIVQIPRVEDLIRQPPSEKIREILSGIKSLLLVPIEFGRTVVGCLGLNAIRQERSWPPDVAALLRVAGEVFASTLERKRAEENLRKSEQFLQQVIDNAPFGAHFYRLEEDGRLVFTRANRSADLILATDHAPLIGKTIDAAFPGLAGTEIPSIYREIALNGTEYIQEQMDYDGAGIKGAFETNAFQTVQNHMAVFFVDISKRKRTEAALAEEATRRRILFEESPDGILIIDPDNLRFLDFNTAAHRQLGYSRDEFAQLSIRDVEALETPEEIRARIANVIREGRSDFETVQRTRTGELRNVHVRAQSLGLLGRSFYHCIWRDITDLKRTEEEREKLQLQLAHAQKMESVGRLAGGIAHDFNNMLGVIIGHSEMAMDQISPEQPLHADLEEIRKAAQRSADLTRQLLAFARRQTVTPKVLNLNDAISGMLKMLRRLIGEDIDLEWRPQPDLDSVSIDPAQLDQILANLCVNARDAIEGVGKISIRTQNVTVSESDRTDMVDVVPGRYVMLAVEDDGCGMSQETLDRLFEPFFTTKEIGRGTGLGLATVYGIVKQNNGFIAVESRPGKGSRFMIHLPPVAAEAEPARTVKPPTDWTGRGETVLLVEDEQSILRLGKRMLQRMGLTVLTAGSPDEAIRLAEERRGQIELLISDVIMPQMNGRELAARISSMNPDLKRLFMSGYTADVIAPRGVLDEGVHFIQKPFSYLELSAKVQELLHSK